MERELSDLRHKLAMGGGGAASGSASEVKDVAGTSVASRILADVPAKELKPLADSLKSQIGSGVVVLISVSDGKASIVVAVTEDLTERLNAVDLVRVGSAALGGKGGGGRPDMAQAGGPDGDAAAQAVTAVEEALVERA